MADASARAMTPAPKQAIAAGDVQESEIARRIRFLRAMERGLKSVQFDSDTWLAQLDTTEHARADAATRLLLAHTPQAAAEPASAPLAMVRRIVLDAAYQLK
jgi:hypothetical protein